MSAGHAAYESLAGAVVLGEATPDERRRFEAHARTCASCRDDAAATPLLRRLRDDAEAETWRPVYRDRVVREIGVRRSGRVQAIGSALVTAAVFSLALDLGLSSGSLGRLAAGWTNERPAASTPVAFVPRIPAGHAAPDVVTAPAPLVRAFAHHTAHRHAHHATARLPIVAPPPPAETTLPDLYGGLAIDPESESRAPHVARADLPPGGAHASASADPAGIDETRSY